MIARHYPGAGRRPRRPSGMTVLGGLLLLGLGLVLFAYNECKIDVGTGQQVVLIRREGLELEPDMELAPPPRTGGPITRACRPAGPMVGS